MKRLPIIVIFFFFLFLAGCSENISDQTSPSYAMPEAEAAEAQTIDENQEISQDEMDKVDDTSIEVNAPAETDANMSESQESPNDKAIIEDQNKVTEEQPGKVNINQGRDFNRYVLDVISTYKIGKYPYLMNEDYNNYNGVTTNLIYQGKVVAKANPSGNKASHCVGITFEVFFKAMQQKNQDLGIPIDNFNNMNWNQMRDFMLTWYVANGSKANSNVAVAVQNYGFGKRILNLEDAKPGDFVDISRENNTGHTVIFIGWIRQNQKIIGLKYWSSQESTNGISYKTEYFNVLDENSKKYGNIDINNFYIARIF